MDERLKDDHAHISSLLPKAADSDVKSSSIPQADYIVFCTAYVKKPSAMEVAIKIRQVLNHAPYASESKLLTIESLWTCSYRIYASIKNRTITVV